MPDSTQTATLTYDLTDYDASYRLQQALAAGDLCAALWDIQQYLRDVVKNDRFSDVDGNEVAYRIAQVVFELIEDQPEAHAVMERYT